jgi:hypothetical protein
MSIILEIMLFGTHVGWMHEMSYMGTLRPNLRAFSFKGEMLKAMVGNAAFHFPLCPPCSVLPLGKHLLVAKIKYDHESAEFHLSLNRLFVIHNVI